MRSPSTVPSPVKPTADANLDPLPSIGSHNLVYRCQSITTIVLFLPWIALGWWALSRENKMGLAVFLAWTAALIITWSIDFYSLGKFFLWTGF
jgi:hypothetical protein